MGSAVFDDDLKEVPKFGNLRPKLPVLRELEVPHSLLSKSGSLYAVYRPTALAG